MILIIDGQEFEFDATLDFGYDDTATATEHPIQRDGSRTRVTDNIDSDPLVLNVTGIMSESPLSGGLLQQFRQAFGDGESGQQWAFLETVRAAKKQGIICEFDAGDRGYFTDLVILGFSPTWDYTIGKSVNFSMTLQELEFVETESSLQFSAQGIVALNVLQVLSDPLNSKTALELATGDQNALIDSAFEFTGLPGVDFVRGR